MTRENHFPIIQRRATVKKKDPFNLLGYYLFFFSIYSIRIYIFIYICRAKLQTPQTKRILQEIINEPDTQNTTCAECGEPDPTWASINIGIFLCLNCSGVHRSLGI